MKKTIPIVGLLVLALTALPFLGGCGSSTAKAPATKAPAAKSSVAAKTLTVGFVGTLGSSMGLDDEHCIQVMAAMDNANGGISIGGVKYKVHLISYDDNNSQTTGVAAVNRLVFQDHAQVILTDNLMGSYLPITDPKKVLLIGGTPSGVNLQPKWHYSFNPSAADTQFPLLVAWFAQKYPDLMKNFVLALPDNQVGHFMAQLIGEPAEVMGAKMTPIYYPPGETDLSSVGTKVKMLNPTVFYATGGGDVHDGLVMTAAWQAGYRGHYFVPANSSFGDLSKVMAAGALNGLIAGALPVEFTPPLTPQAKAFTAAYAAKFGKWNSPNTTGTSYYACMKAAYQAAGTTDPDKVAAVVENGLKFTSPVADYQMIPPANVKNPKTVDSISSLMMKKIENGKPVLVGKLSLSQSLALWQKLLAAEAKMKPAKS